MRRMAFLIAAIAFFPGMALAQNPNAYLIYGNRDGSPMNVHLGSIIEIPAWGAIDTSGGIQDTVTFLFLPLMSNDSIITDRLGGTFPDTLVGHWDDASFLAPLSHQNDPEIPIGFATQSMLGFADLVEPLNPQDYIRATGDTVLLCIFLMRTTSDPRYDGQTVCPLSRGHDPVNGDLIWYTICGRAIVPAETYGCLHFISGQSAQDEAIPSDFALSQNYPNPFNPSTNIEFSLANDDGATLMIYDLLGRHVKTLLDKRLAVGRYIITWDGKNESGWDVPSGTYFYRLKTESNVETKRMTLIR